MKLWANFSDALCGCTAGFGRSCWMERQEDGLQSMQVRHQHLQFLLVKLAAEWRHHAAAANDALHHVLVSRGQAAGQVLLLI